MKLLEELLEELNTKRLQLTVDTDTAYIIHSMLSQSYPPVEIKTQRFEQGEFTMNSVIVILEEDAFLVRDNIFDLSDGLINFLTNRDVLYGDNEEEETIIKRFFT